MKWEKKEKKGSGHWATVHSACLGKDCGFVMKQYGKKYNKFYSVDDFLKEIKIQSILAKSKIAPTIHHVDVERRMFVMDELQLNFVQFIQQEIEKNTLIRTKQNNIRLAVQEIISIIKKMHSKGFAHDDLEHGGNMMMNKCGKWFLVDFGTAIENANETEKRQDFDSLWFMMFVWAQDSQKIQNILLPSLQIIDTVSNQNMKRKNFHEYLRTVQYPPDFVKSLRKSINAQL